MNPLYQVIADRANHRCEYCHAPEIAFNFPFEVEHIIPKSRQGSDENENLALSCRSCNLHKANRIGGINRDTKLATRFFNPRIDQWHEHFQLMPAGEIVGETMIGQVTVESFNMNAPAQIGARQLWIRWGLLP
jgi:pyruvate-formate lyase-activating enzyme